MGKAQESSGRSVVDEWMEEDAGMLCKVCRKLKGSIETGNQSCGVQN